MSGIEYGDGFIQFGDGVAVPVRDIEWTFTKNGPEVEEVFKLPRVSDSAHQRWPTALRSLTTPTWPS